MLAVMLSTLTPQAYPAGLLQERSPSETLES